MCVCVRERERERDREREREREREKERERERKKPTSNVRDPGIETSVQLGYVCVFVTNTAPVRTPSPFRPLLQIDSSQ